jgi:hypothetical protein
MYTACFFKSTDGCPIVVQFSQNLINRCEICRWRHGNRWNQCCGSGFGSRGTKLTNKNRRKLINSFFYAGRSLLRKEGFGSGFT